MMGGRIEGSCPGSASAYGPTLASREPHHQRRGPGSGTAVSGPCEYCHDPLYLRARAQDRLGEGLAVKDGLFEEEEEGVSPVVEAEFKEKEQFKTNA